MAKNRKPRKKYHPKVVRMPCFKESDMADLNAMITRIELKAELALPMGTMQVVDMNAMKTLLNHAIVGISARDYLDKDERAAAQKILDVGGDALVSVVHHAVERVKPGETPSFICTAAELAQIRSAIAIAAAFIRDSLEVCPTRTLREFFAMKALLKRLPHNTTVTSQMVESLIDRMACVPTIEWDKL